MSGGVQRKGYAFGTFVLDTAAHQLLRDGVPVPLKPKVFETLMVLLERAGHLLSKDELLRRVWPGTIVEEASLTQNVYELRRALGGDQRLIENVSRRGYRFVGEVTVIGNGPARMSIAVLPFRRVAGPAGDESLELGIADALITVLTNVPGLVVRPLSAVSRYGGMDRDALAAARELDVTIVVDGSVQTAGDRVRVTVRLLDIPSGAGRWAGKFDEKADDIFALQDAIAGKVAAAVAPELAEREHETLTRRYTESREAYHFYSKGRYHWNKATEEGLWKAIEFFRAAIAADPRYALAWVGIADAYTSLDWYGVLSTKDSNPQARAAAEAAVGIDDSLAEAHASLAMARQYAWDWEGAESEYRTALALNPNSAPARQWYGIFLCFLGRFEEAMAEMRRAQELDPVSLSIGSQLGLVLLCARRYEEAAAQVTQVLDLDAESVEALFYLAMIRVLQGEAAEGIAICRRLPQENPDFRAMLAHALGAAHVIEEARSIIRELQRTPSNRHVPFFWMSIAHLGIGDHDQALTCLEKACHDPDDSLLGVMVFPLCDPIRTHPRYMAVLRRMGL